MLCYNHQEISGDINKRKVKMLWANCLALFIKTCETGKSNGQILQNNQIIVCHIKVYRYKMTMKNLISMTLLIAVAALCSHHDAADPLISRFFEVVNLLDSVTGENPAPEVKDIRDVLLDPETILFLILCTDFLPM